MTPNKPTAVFAFGSTQPADLADNALRVVAFLSDVTANSGTRGELGLSEKGEEGLNMVLKAIENTLDLAITRI